MKKANFKAILAMLLVGVMGVSMTACSGNGDTASSGESSSAENSSAASASEELPEPVELNIASFRVGTHNAAAPRRCAGRLSQSLPGTGARLCDGIRQQRQAVQYRRSCSR